ncbi:hypothetical protein BBB02_04225 [Wolbachia endosymbiont of Bemisia tabaci]|uniref:hypothetical protein n=1 Tax=Wolbachia endosymbiont of Bemisia tabaci TaxID=215173 RepID=UPI000FD16C9B|nr:hypothetical protein [Wolbachia endosymbiont of Bemisia tabaci]AZU37702.1 hypothetical protein BBB02_04225 [Wolbachia endosymbiont of Bemisia tabaci]
MSTNFPILKDILAELKRKNSITVLEEHCQQKWEVYDLLMDLTNDENLKQAYIDLSFNKSFKKNFIELANQAKKAISKYFRDKDIDLRAFYVETNNSDKVLNINLINYNRSEPIRISDILQQERDISTLNIYCDKKHDIYAYRKGKERRYEFKEDAYYEMTSTWPVQDKDGKTFTCTMVMNVSNSGITKVLQFNGKDFESPPEEFWELIRQNEELYIQGLSLHDAVKALLKKNKNANIAPAVSNLQNNEHIVINQDEKLKDLENDAKSNPILSFTSNNVSKVNTQQIATQAIATQTKVNSQQLDQKLTKAEQEIRELNELRNNLQHRLDKAEQEFEKHNSNLQNELGEEKQKNEKLANMSTELQERVQKLESVYEKEKEDLKKRLEVANAEKEELTSEVRKLQEESDQLLSSCIVKLKKSEQELMEAKQEIEALEKCNSDLQNKLEEEKQKNVKLQIGLTQKDEKLENISTELQGKIQELEGAYEEKKDLKKKLEIANAEREKLKGEVNKLEEDASENEKEVERMRDEHSKSLMNLKSQMQSLDDKQNTNQEFHKQEVAQLKWKYEELKNEVELKNKQIKSQEEQLRQYERLTNLKPQMQNLQSEHNAHLESDEQEVSELEWDEKWDFKSSEGEGELETKDEQIERQREQLRQEMEEEIMDQYRSFIEPKLEEYENEIEILKEKIKDQAMEIERITGEREKLNGKEQHLNNQVEMLSTEISQQESLNNRAKISDQLVGEVDNAERKSRFSSFDSAFHSDNDDHCNSLLDLISSPSKVCSQSQQGSVK